MFEKVEPNDAAFATQYQDEGQVGLTKREYVAAAALSGLLANDHWEYELAAENAVAYANALIKELNK